MRVLVVIASYGSKNDRYLEQVLSEYRSLPYEIDIVVLSNIQKDLGPGIELRVGLPTANPLSLPYGHKQIFADRIERYDLFIYSEDDMLISGKNIEAFLGQSAVLPPGQVPGFLRIEAGPEGKRQYCDFHEGFCWDANSVQRCGDHTFAFFTNEHAACYLLTQKQLEQALLSAKFLVPPHRGKYGPLESAATDPYTQCGLKKMICISDLDSASVFHLPNKYYDDFGLPEADMQIQVEALLKIPQNGGTHPPLIQMEGRLKACRYLRDHSGPARTEILSLIPPGTRSVLSFGCGETEIALARQGIRVCAVPVDAVMSAPAASEGVELLGGDLESATARLQGQTFDCLLLVDVLHLVPQPAEVVTSFASFLRDDGLAIALMPDISGARFLSGWLLRGEAKTAFSEAGVHMTSYGLAKRWFEGAGMVVSKPTFVDRKQQHVLGKRLPPFLSRLVERNFLLTARRPPAPTHR